MEGILSNMDQRHQKQVTYMRGMLDGMGYHRALEALEFACRLDEGQTRKDGHTPCFHHQLQVARLVSTLLPHLQKPEEALAASFLHDVLEDHHDIVTRDMLEHQFGHDVASAVWKLSKKMGHMVKDQDAYFEELTRCPIASIVKLADRSHNLHTMQGVFNGDKQISYVKALDERFFPMLRKARHRYPRQYGAYENLKILLLCQYELLAALVRERA